MKLSKDELAVVSGGLDNGCHVSNWSTTTTAVTPNGGATTQLGQSASTKVPHGEFTVAQNGESITSTCAPGRGFVVSNARAGNSSWGLGTVSRPLKL